MLLQMKTTRHTSSKTIKGFEDEYEEGYEFVVKVKAVNKNQDEPVQDLLGYYYYLLEILNKEKV